MRDKIIELIGFAPYGNRSMSACFFADTIEGIADFLIAHGVTFAEDNNVGCKSRSETCSIANPFKELSEGMARLIEKLEQQTNADRIRAMTDEELADFFWGFHFEDYSLEDGVCYTKRKLLKWLKQPAEAET